MQTQLETIFMLNGEPTKKTSKHQVKLRKLRDDIEMAWLLHGDKMGAKLKQSADKLETSWRQKGDKIETKWK